RFAEGQSAKPVLTGIPKGPKNNGGALLATADGSLLVATGDAGNPRAAADRTSLAGKILRIDASGRPAEDNPEADSAVYASGLHSPGGMCQAMDGSRLWVTDRTERHDAVYRIEAGEELTSPVWTWKDKPGVSGCSDWTDTLAVSTEEAGNIQNLPLTAEGSVSGDPQTTLDGRNGPSYGRIGSLDQVTQDVAVAGTVNYDGCDPVSSVDRVVLIDRPPASGSGRDRRPPARRARLPRTRATPPGHPGTGRTRRRSSPHSQRGKRVAPPRTATRRTPRPTPSHTRPPRRRSTTTAVARFYAAGVAGRAVRHTRRRWPPTAEPTNRSASPSTPSGTRPRRVAPPARLSPGDWRSTTASTAGTPTRRRAARPRGRATRAMTPERA